MKQKQLNPDSIEYKYEKLKKVNEKLDKSVKCLENLAQSQADENIELIRENQKYQKLQEKYTKAKDIITELLA